MQLSSDSNCGCTELIYNTYLIDSMNLDHDPTLSRLGKNICQQCERNGQAVEKCPLISSAMEDYVYVVVQSWPTA